MRREVSDQLRSARDDTRRFLRLSDVFIARLKSGECSYHLPERAAMLRASLDLTRALARIRKPGATDDTIFDPKD